MGYFSNTLNLFINSMFPENFAYDLSFIYSICAFTTLRNPPNWKTNMASTT